MNLALSIVIKTTMLLLFALLLSLSLRRAAASTRHAIWTIALTGMLLLPVASFVLPTIELPVLSEPALNESSYSEPPVVHLDNEHFQVGFDIQDPHTDARSAPAPIEPSRSWPLQRWIVLGWALGATFVGVRFVLGMLMIRAIAQRSRIPGSDEWRDLLVQLRWELSVFEHVQLLIADGPIPPMTWGIFRYTILLPPAATEWTAHRRRLVLAHELTHVKRRDGLTQLLVQAVCTVYWFNPLVWLAVHRLHFERERACDDQVLRLGNDPQDYAEHLLEIARALSNAPHVSSATVSMAHRSQLESRLRAILDFRLRRHKLTRLAAALLIGILAGLTFSIAATQLSAVASLAIPATWPLAPPVEQNSAAVSGQQSTAADATASIEGVVVSLGTGEPVSQAKVGLGKAGDDGPSPYTATTSDDGKFVFQNIPSGEYRLVATHSNGYIPVEYGQRNPLGRGTAITLTTGQRLAGLQLAIAPTGSISGHIYDRDGEPVGQARVQALKLAYLPSLFTADRSTRPQLTMVQSVLTNDLGEYRIFWLPPGRYYLSARPENVQAREWSQLTPPDTPLRGQWTSAPPVVTRRTLDSGEVLEEVYVPAYFPGTTDPSGASAIDLGPGDNLERIDMIVAPPMPARRVQGVIVDSTTGQPAVRASVRLVPHNLGHDTSVPNGRTNQNGTFDLSGIVPGSYFLVASLGEDEELTGKLPIDIGNANVQKVTLVIRPRFNIRGRVIIEGQRYPGDGPLNLSLELNSVPLGLMPFARSPGSPPPNVSPDGYFTFQGVAPGDYRVLVAEAEFTQTSYVKSIRLSAADVLRDGLHVTKEPDGELEIVISNGVATIDGIVVDGKQKPVTNAIVALAPFAAPVYRGDLYKNVSTDAAGRFHIQGIAPGDYTVLAWEDIEDGAWRDPEFIKDQENHGRRIHLYEGSKENLSLTVIQ